MTTYKWDWEKWEASMPPAMRRNHLRRMKVIHMVMWMHRHHPWMGWPILKVVYLFWHNIFDEGIVSTCKPRWGALTFAYLNDGNKPTLWHTWRQITRDSTDPYTGLYVDERGAPKSLEQAKEWERLWDMERGT